MVKAYCVALAPLPEALRAYMLGCELRIAFIAELAKFRVRLDRAETCNRMACWAMFEGVGP